MNALIAKLSGAELATMVAEGIAYNGTPLVAARDMSVLGGETIITYRAALSPNIVPFRDQNAVVVRTRFGTSLWVNPQYQGYRDAYERYAEIYRAFPGGLSGVDVDHLYNKARAKHFGFGFVRMFPVITAINQQHGWKYELQTGISELNRTNVKPVQFLDEMSFLKVRGVPALGKGEAPSQSHHEYARWNKDTFGFAESTTLDNLRALQLRANGWKF